VREDLELIERIKKDNDSAALVELSNRHSGIFYETINRNMPFFSGTNFIDEIKDRRDYYVFKAASSYKEDKGSFCTWFSNQVRYACLSARTKESKSIFCEPFYKEPLDRSGAIDGFNAQDSDSPYFGIDLEKKDLVNEISKFVDQKLKPKEKKIFNDRVFCGKSFSLISEELKLTPQAIQAIFSATREKIKNKFKDATVII
jgi:RNA polymerase sigma factor (sigma-70 family)